MASRAIWKGHLRLSLVSIPIEIHTATKPGARVSFVQIHEPSGERVRHVKTVPGIGPIETSDIIKGYELGDDEYMLIKSEEIDAIKLETSKTFELVQFVDAAEIPPLYFEKPYLVIPSEPLGEDAYRVVRDAMRETGSVGIGQITMRGKEYLCTISAYLDGMLMETLLYADELRSAEPLFSEIADTPSDPDLLAVAKQLITKKKKPFDAAAFEDRFDVALKEMIAAKRNNRTTLRTTVSADGPRPANNVIDLMAALKNSLKASGTRAAKAGSAGAAVKAKEKSPVAVHPRVKETLESKGLPPSRKKPATKNPAKTASKPAAKPSAKAAPKKAPPQDDTPEKTRRSGN